MPDPDESLYGRDVSHQYGVEIVSALLVSMNLGCLHAEQARNGAPGDVHALAQTTDGFLWLGTMQGLCRRSSIRCPDAGGLPFLRACMLVFRRARPGLTGLPSHCVDH